jgi:hypothetical protein
MFGLLLRALVSAVLSPFRSRAALELEILALRHQLAVYQRTCARPRLKPADRIFWSWLSRMWSGWRHALVMVQPRTVTGWQRRKFREHWTKLTRSGKQGRPAVAKEVRDLIRRMSSANSLWGAPRILGELSKVGIVVAKSTVEKYMIRCRKPPSPTWRAFLKNHVNEIVAIDFFVVPTVRAPRSPWQNPYVERLIGSIRRDCLDHVNVLNERHLRRIVGASLDYDHRSRTHLSLEMDCPEHREVQQVDRGRVIEIAEVGGLHHRYERQAA